MNCSESEEGDVHESQDKRRRRNIHPGVYASVVRIEVQQITERKNVYVECRKNVYEIEEVVNKIKCQASTSLVKLIVSHILLGGGSFKECK